MGCSIALELARRGHRPVVLDKGPGAGAGSTSASSAIIRFNYSTPDAVKLAWESAHMMLANYVIFAAIAPAMRVGRLQRRRACSSTPGSSTS